MGIKYAAFVDTDSQHVDERVRHDQVVEDCVAGYTIVFAPQGASPTEIDADGRAVGETQEGNQLPDGLRIRPIFVFVTDAPTLVNLAQLPVCVVLVSIARVFADRGRMAIHFDDWHPLPATSANTN